MHASNVNTARTMPFSPHSILQEIVRFIGFIANGFLENLGGSEYDYLNFRSGCSSLDVIVLRFFTTLGLCRSGRLHHLKFEVKLLRTKNR
jgi:hypothetical protein